MMGGAVENPIALLDGGLTNGLSQVALACAGWTESEGVLVASDEGAGGQIENQAAIHFGIEGEVKLSRLLVGSRNSACLRRRSSKRSPRRVNSSLTKQEIRSIKSRY